MKFFGLFSALFLSLIFPLQAQRKALIFEGINLEVSAPVSAFIKGEKVTLNYGLLAKDYGRVLKVVPLFAEVHSLDEKTVTLTLGDQDAAVLYFVVEKTDAAKTKRVETVPIPVSNSNRSGFALLADNQPLMNRNSIPLRVHSLGVMPLQGEGTVLENLKVEALEITVSHGSKSVTKTYYGCAICPIRNDFAAVTADGATVTLVITDASRKLPDDRLVKLPLTPEQRVLKARLSSKATPVPVARDFPR